MLITCTTADGQPKNGPLVYPNWPPKPSPPTPRQRPHLLLQLRNINVPRFPIAMASNLFYNKRPPPPPQLPLSPQQTIMANLRQQYMRPFKMPMPHYFPTAKNQPYQFAKKPSTPNNGIPAAFSSSPGSSITKIKFHSSPSGPHTGEYVFENPFTHITVSTPPPAAPVSLYTSYLIMYTK